MKWFIYSYCQVTLRYASAYFIGYQDFETQKKRPTGTVPRSSWAQLHPIDRKNRMWYSVYIHIFHVQAAIQHPWDRRIFGLRYSGIWSALSAAAAGNPGCIHKRGVGFPANYIVQRKSSVADSPSGRCTGLFELGIIFTGQRLQLCPVFLFLGCDCSECAGGFLSLA